MKVSVIIPCFNSSSTIDETIESARIQAGADTEIIVIDDGSTDNSLAIAKKFSPVVRVFSGPNRGVSSARNWAIAEAVGDWFVFLDADDTLLPGTLAKRLETAASADADVILCDYFEGLQTDRGVVEGDVRRVDMTLLKDDPEIACIDDVSITTAALMYNKRIVEKIGGFRQDLPIIQDQRFFFDAAYHGARFAYSPHIGARYRITSSSLSHKNRELVWRDMLINTQQIEALWRLRGPLSTKQQYALAKVYDGAGRKLFAMNSPDYFLAVKYLQGVLGHLPLYSRIATALAATIGLRAAYRILNLTPDALRPFFRFQGSLK
jgi:glycosyltransferase involved in cell wall biosynthesis